MFPLASSPRQDSAVRGRLAGRLLLALLFPVLAFAVGCSGGKGGAKGEVRGKVTYNDKPVAGIVTFVGEDNKEYASPIGEGGTYTVGGLPAGKMRVKVTSMLLSAGPGPVPPGGAAAPGGAPLPMDKDEMGKIQAQGGVPPPAKYASLDNGLTFEANGKKQEWDIPLK